ncbi:sugar phosphate nucleotidyltransferase [Lacipirellula limnantheis]|uniref:Bifunctional protein GlmU n=1 Tax=Lacipirellula limnantheis TaxID=2528024 RepID=A0A517TUX0_9BACT|nr:NTP transferase domain-containing protein [Lacipirellula limnantheis]QDT72171.1 Bifunctional protein GlmU [Lacipirellula limnantheis]
MPAPAAMAIVLAAGKGTRMKSELPKVLVPVAGRPMIRYVIDALRSAGVERIVVVVGYRADLVRAELAGLPGVEFADQTEQLGTGHAVMMCRQQLAAHDGPVVVVAGDSPMLQADSVAALIAESTARQAACLLGTVRRDDPTGYGRIIRNAAGDFTAIVEEKDATPEQRAVKEINVSTYVFSASDLLDALDQLRTDNSQREYYITDCPAILLAAGKPVAALNVLKPREALSINSPEELAQVEKVMSGA